MDDWPERDPRILPARYGRFHATHHYLDYGQLRIPCNLGENHIPYESRDQYPDDRISRVVDPDLYLYHEFIFYCQKEKAGV